MTRSERAGMEVWGLVFGTGTSELADGRETGVWAPESRAFILLQGAVVRVLCPIPGIKATRQSLRAPFELLSTFHFMALLPIFSNKCLGVLLLEPKGCLGNSFLPPCCLSVFPGVNKY